MNYSFEYIDIILLAMIAGFIFLRLRGILGKRTGFDGKAPAQFDKILKEAATKKIPKQNDVFEEGLVKRIFLTKDGDINLITNSTLTKSFLISTKNTEYKKLKKARRIG